MSYETCGMCSADVTNAWRLSLCEACAETCEKSLARIRELEAEVARLREAIARHSVEIHEGVRDMNDVDAHLWDALAGGGNG